MKKTVRATAEILSNILSLSLEIPGAATPVSLLTATLNYPTADAVNSDLSKILQTFVKYPESTQALIQELELLSRDLIV